MARNIDLLTADLAAYFEREMRKDEVRVAFDPSIEGVAAVRITRRADLPIDLLWTRDAGTTPEQRIEECTWESFPPRTR